MKMLFMDKEEQIKKKGKVISIADFCCGTGGMLSVGQKYINSKNKDAKVIESQKISNSNQLFSNKNDNYDSLNEDTNFLNVSEEIDNCESYSDATFIEITPLDLEINNETQKDLSSVPISEIDFPKIV